MGRYWKQAICLTCLSLCLSLALSAEMMTNAIKTSTAPKWLKETRVDKIVNRVQYYMEWTVRRIPVRFHTNMSEFEKSHGLGPGAMAVAINRGNQISIQLSPNVNDNNFDAVFAHEMAHVISYQKYKGAIPNWLEEGMASFVSKKEDVDYKWLAKQPFPKDVRLLKHPYKGSKEETRYHYRASQAVIEMLNKKCDLENLLRLSVERKMENYIDTYCGIKDINASFQAWVKSQAK